MADDQPEAGGGRGAAGGRRQGEHQQRTASGIVLEELAGWSGNTLSGCRAGWRFGARMCRGDSEPTSSHFASLAIEWDMRNRIINCSSRHPMDKLLNDYRLKPVGCLARKRALRLKPS